MTTRSTQPRSCRRGFTLIEVLVTLVMVGIVLAVAMKGISLALFASGDARHKLEATSLAENKLAELTAGLVLEGNAGGGATDFGPDWPGYRCETTNTPNREDPDLTEIQVRVIWNARNTKRSVTLSTMVYTGLGTPDPETSTASAAPATGGGR